MAVPPQSECRRLSDESLDAFADALIHLANLGYPKQDPALRMELAKDRVMAGL